VVGNLVAAFVFPQNKRLSERENLAMVLFDLLQLTALLGLTGSPEQVKAASQAYRTYYKAHPADENGEYLVDHSTFSYLVMPGEGVVDFFRREVRPEQMADSIGCFLDQS